LIEDAESIELAPDYLKDLNSVGLKTESQTDKEVDSKGVTFLSDLEPGKNLMKSF
jgi:hypothetical protein